MIVQSATCPLALQTLLSTCWCWAITRKTVTAFPSFENRRIKVVFCYIINMIQKSILLGLLILDKSLQCPQWENIETLCHGKVFPSVTIVTETQENSVSFH